MKTKFCFLIIFSLLIASRLSGQNISTETIRWNSPSWFDPSSGSGVQELTSVISSPTNITWKYEGDSIKHDMIIRGTTGSWSNVANNGSITFQADSGDDSAVVEFKKTSERTLIRILIVKPEETLIYVLDVTDTVVL